MDYKTLPELSELQSLQPEVFNTDLHKPREISYKVEDSILKEASIN